MARSVTLATSNPLQFAEHSVVVSHRGGHVGDEIRRKPPGQHTAPTALTRGTIPQYPDNPVGCQQPLDGPVPQ
jgi:hypothetical protein